MRTLRSLAILLLCLPVKLFATSASSTPVCDLLTKTSVEQAQNGKFFSSQPTVHDDGNFTSAQCFYKLQPESSSVSLQMITSSAKDRFHPREFWRKKFHPTKADEAEDAQGKAEVDREREEAEQKHKKAPQHVAGLGDDAFWVDTGRDGALYVLSGESILRLSLGGRTPQPEKMKKASSLAKLAIQKLNEGAAGNSARK